MEPKERSTARPCSMWESRATFPHLSSAEPTTTVFRAGSAESKNTVGPPCGPFDSLPCEPPTAAVSDAPQQLGLHHIRKCGARPAAAWSLCAALCRPRWNEAAAVTWTAPTKEPCQETVSVSETVLKAGKLTMTSSRQFGKHVALACSMKDVPVAPFCKNEPGWLSVLLLE